MLCYKNLFSFIFTLIILSKCSTKPLCNSNLYCDSCDFCGLESASYSPCFYGNMFCKNDSKIIYSSYLKEEFTIFFDNDPELIDFCGEVEYELENMKEAITLFTNRNKTFPKNNLLRCHYLISSINESFGYPYLEINLEDLQRSNETKNTSDINAEINAIFKLIDSDLEEIEVINSSKLVDNYYIYPLRSITRFEIFIDIKLLKEKLNEVLEIKLNFGQKFHNSTARYYKTSTSTQGSTTTSTTEESDSISGSVIGGSIGGAVGFIVMGLIVYFCCCKTEKRYIEVETTTCGIQ